MSDFPAAADSSVPAAAISANPKIMIALLWAVVACTLAVPVIKDGVFDAMSTDDAMRLVEVRDLIAGQAWFDLAQHRLDPPGTPMHWSRVIDAPLAALILMLRPLAGMEGAEAITLTLWPTLLFGAALILVAATARRIGDGVNQHAGHLTAIILAPHSLGTPVCDAFGGPFLLLIAGGGVSLMIVAGVTTWQSTTGAGVTACAATGLMLLGGFFKLFPGCLASPYAAVDPLVASVWLDH